MPERAAVVPYQGYEAESQRLTTPQTQSPEDYLDARAQPQTEVGQSLQKLGAAGEEVGNKAVDLFGGMIAETAANQAELGFIKDSGDVTAKFHQYEGLQADAMRPQYNAALEDIHAKYRANLPLAAQQMYDANTTRNLGYQTRDYADYAAGQVKKANITSQQAISLAAVNSASNLKSVLDDTQVGEALGTISHSGNVIADATGLGFKASGQDPATGNYTYPDTPEGNAAKAQHLQFTDGEKAKYFLTAAKTVADNMGASSAADWAQKHWDLMPDAAKVQMNQFLAPKMKNEAISGNVSAMNAGINADYNKQAMNNVPGSPTELTQEQQNPLDVIRKNEGIGYSNDSKGEVINGINSQAYPKEFAEAKHILDTEGQAAATKYADDFYQKNIIDKYDIKSLPPQDQVIVADGLVNHGTGSFGQSLIEAAKNGASPQQLIDMRRAEYQRLATADPQQYGSSLKGWNARLDNLQGGIGAPGNKADFLRDHQEEYVQNAVNSYLKQYPDDYYGAAIQERRARTEITHQISMEDGKLKADRDSISGAIDGSLTNGKPPSTYEELRQLPGMAPVLDKVMQQQRGYFNTIDTMIAKASRRDEVTNSPNAYDTILRTLEPYDGLHPNMIRDQGQLQGLLGKSDNTGINMKDYKDAKDVLETSDNWKTFLDKNMRQISNANGNVDGQGQTRALDWYHKTMQMYKDNQSKGEKALPEDELIKNIQEGTTGHHASRMEQISNWAKSMWNEVWGGNQSTGQPQNAAPTATGPNGEKYVLQGGQWVKQ